MPPKKKPESAGNVKNRTAGAGSVSVAIEALTDAQRQILAYEEAIREFRAGQFERARAAFEKAAAGPQPQVTHNARHYISVCGQRLVKPKLEFQTPDDHYNYAIARINAGELAVAREHLEQACQLRPGSDYIHYALAACLAMSGEVRSAYENLKRAIELDPRNRITARQDPDFASVVHQPLVQTLLYPEKTSPF